MNDRIGLGVVAKDQNGKVIMATSKTVRSFVDVEHAEIEVFNQGVLIAKERAWEKVCIVRDAKAVVEALQDKFTRGFHNQVLVKNIQNLIQAWLTRSLIVLHNGTPLVFVMMFGLMKVQPLVLSQMIFLNDRALHFLKKKRD